MADHRAARERCTTFLQKWTEAVDPQDLPVLDECPICLENYDQEQSVRIKIEGCNHVFGRSCLATVLTNNPRLEKKCPLCRTLWIKAPAGAAGATVARESAAAAARAQVDRYLAAFSNMEATVRSSAAQRSSQARPRPRAIQTALVAETNSRAGLPTFPRLHIPPVASAPAPDARTDGFRARRLPEYPLINLIDSDSDDDPLESFNSITRDINSVRERARITQVSRRQRKEDKKESATRTLPRAPTVKGERENGSSSGQREPGQQKQQEPHTRFPTSSWDPLSRPRPMAQNVQNRIMQNWGLANDANDGNQSANVVADGSEHTFMEVDDEATTQDIEQNPVPLPLPATMPNGDCDELIRSDDPGPVPPLSPAVQQPRPRFAPRSSSLRQARENRVPPSPFILSSTPESDTEEDNIAAFQRQSERERLDQPKEGLFDERARDLQERETRLNVREGVLEARERALDQREERVQERERSDTRSKAVRRTQLHELESMLARHRQELVDEV